MGNTPATQPVSIIVDSPTTWSVSKSGSLVAQTGNFQEGATVAIKARTVDSAGNPLSGVQAFLEVRNSGGVLIKSLLCITLGVTRAIQFSLEGTIFHFHFPFSIFHFSYFIFRNREAKSSSNDK